MILAKEVHALTLLLPRHERFGLTSQINRNVISIPSNIAEGAGRDTDEQFNYFLSIAVGSAYELETQLLLCTTFGYLTHDQIARCLELVREIQKIIYGLKNSLILDNKVSSK